MNIVASVGSSCLLALLLACAQPKAADATASMPAGTVSPATSASVSDDRNTTGTAGPPAAMRMQLAGTGGQTTAAAGSPAAPMNAGASGMSMPQAGASGSAGVPAMTTTPMTMNMNAGGAAAPSAGAAAPATELDPAKIVSGLDGYLYKGECAGGTASYECPIMGCQQNVLRHEGRFAVAGDSTTVYELTLHVYGVVELRHDYTGGMRRQGSAANDQSKHDFLYLGGSYEPGAGYNVYGLRVEPAVAGVAASDGGNNYFLNARDTSSEGHEVYMLDYELRVPATGGSTIVFTAYDPNCLQIMNNRETARPMGSGTGADGALIVDAVSAAKPPPQDLVQPLSSNGRTGQWIFIDVVAVVPRS